MTPKEKAIELFEKCYDAIPSNDMGLNDDASEKCALIAVDEMISVLTDLNGIYNIKPALVYWQEVKQEIEKL